MGGCHFLYPEIVLEESHHSHSPLNHGVSSVSRVPKTALAELHSKLY